MPRKPRYPEYPGLKPYRDRHGKQRFYVNGIPIKSPRLAHQNSAPSTRTPEPGSTTHSRSISSASRGSEPVSSRGRFPSP